MKVICLVWGPFGFRLDELAEAVNGERVSMTLLYGPRYFAPLRYITLFLRTLILLLAPRPEIVYAQNPPIFCPLTCLLYCKLTNSRLIVDHHSIWSVKTIGRGPVSRMIGLLERVVARSADHNTVPHREWADELRRMGALRTTVIHDFVSRNEYGRDDSVRAKYVKGGLIAIGSHGGHPLERIEVEISAVSLVSSVKLLITGPTEKLSRRLSQEPRENAEYLGFLRREEYERLKASADFAVNITDEPYTLSHVLFEYAASSLPVISSRQRVVEEVFGDSLVYVDSSLPGDVAEKVKLFTDEKVRESYRRRIRAKFEELSRLREGELRRLKDVVSSSH